MSAQASLSAPPWPPCLMLPLLLLAGLSLLLLLLLLLGSSVLG
jgi:hypothetical protein